MHRQLTAWNRLIVFIVCTSAVSISEPAGAAWIITGLGTLGGNESTALDINNSGQIVGWSFTSGNNAQNGFITAPGGTGMTSLGTLGDTWSHANGINDSGQVTGYDETSGVYRSFLTGANGMSMTSLGTLGGIYNEARGINSSGQVVGYDTTGNKTGAFITGADGTGMNSLGTLGGSSSIGNGINDSGQAVGYSFMAGDTSYHAFITGPQGADIIDLGTLGGRSSEARAVNNLGQATGWSDTSTASATYHAFVTSANGVGMKSLGTLGGNASYATAINNQGQVVGMSSTADDLDHTIHAFLYSDGLMIDLSELSSVVADGWAYLHPNAINDHGQIVGQGFRHGSDRQAFLLSYIPESAAIPEPGTFLLVGLGLFGLMMNGKGNHKRAMGRLREAIRTGSKAPPLSELV